MILHKFPLKFLGLAMFLFESINPTKFIFLVLLTTSLTVQAGWNLDQSNSSIEFISIKNNQILERHSFQKISGNITSEGLVNVTIDLDSVNTKIPIRDERMRNLFFETKIFPNAIFSAQIPTTDLNFESEHFRIVKINGQINLHGIEAELKSRLIVLNNDKTLRVMTNYPLLITAEDFNLTEGVAKLQKIAGLDAISSIVPVILDLVFLESKD